jgi:hypothetical protein
VQLAELPGRSPGILDAYHRRRQGQRHGFFIRVDVPGRVAGDFIEVALDAGNITPGDYG